MRIPPFSVVALPFSSLTNLFFQDLEECVSFLHVKTLSSTSAEILIDFMERGDVCLKS